MMKVAEVIPASWPSEISSTSTSKPFVCAQRRDHAQHHLGPVLRVGAARAGVNLADRVALVVLAAEQRAQLQLVERPTARPATSAISGSTDSSPSSRADLVQRLHVGQPALEVDP